MNKEIIPHIFSSLLNLELYLSKLSATVGAFDAASTAMPNRAFDKIRESIPELQKVISQMRRIANSLQLEIAQGRHEQATRSLRIFYGLQYMVRGELLKSLGEVMGASEAASALDRAHSNQPDFHTGVVH